MKGSRRVWLIGLAVVGLVGAAPEPRSSVELRVVSYNTHGLPGWVARDEPERRFPEIARLLNGYDVALLQEDFAWHELLSGELRHPVVSRGDPERDSWSRGWWWLDGSGLTIAADVAEPEFELGLDRWLGACSGWLGSSFDCWASKGVLMLRLKLANGAEVDAYTLHLDAGRGDADREARRLQLARLTELVREHSPGRALVLGGDFNLHDADAADLAELERFKTSLGLRDSGARPEPGGPWRTRVDYLFWRSGDDVTLELLDAGVAREFEPGGTALSDHPALFAHLSVR